MTQNYRCWVEIGRSAFRHNAKVVRERIGKAEMLVVVKANAYGHGLMGVAEALSDDAQLFGVANLEEAVALRERFHLPVIILGPSLPEEMLTIVERGFIPTISTFDEAQAFDRVGAGEVGLAEHRPAVRRDVDALGLFGVGHLDDDGFEALLEVFEVVVQVAQAERRSTSKLLLVAIQSRSKNTRKRSGLLSIASFASRAPAVARTLDPEKFRGNPWPVPCNAPTRPSPQKAQPRTLTQGATVKRRGHTLIVPTPWAVDCG